MKIKYTWTEAESRLIRKGFIGNIANVTKGSFEEHIKGPIDAGNLPKAVLGVPVTVIDVFANAPDAAVAAIFKQDIEPLDSVTFARTRRDVSITVGQTVDAVGNLLTFHWIAAGGNLARGGLGALRTVTSDLPTDGLDLIIGTDVERDISRTRSELAQNFSFTA